MMDLDRIGAEIAAHRRERGWTQPELARRAGVGRSTLAALEGGKLGELGFNKVAMILAALGLELKLAAANRGRPTFEELQAEDELRTRVLHERASPFDRGARTAERRADEEMRRARRPGR